MSPRSQPPPTKAAPSPSPRRSRIASAPATEGLLAVREPPADSAAEKAEKKEGPAPAKKPLRFERGELPVFVLSLLAEHGALRRPAITEAAFTAAPSKLNKQRINGTITTLLEKGYALQLGTMRLFTYKITKEGKAYLRREQKEAKKT